MKPVLAGVKLFLLSFISVSCYGQLNWNKMHFGAKASGSAKARLIAADGQRFNPWGNLGLSLVHVLDGSEESNLKLATKVGLAIDFEQYSVNDFIGFGLDRTLLQINPEVLFPLKIADKELSFCTGIGADVHLGSRLWMNNISSSDLMNAYYYDNFEHKERKIIPFVNFGFLLKLHKNFLLQAQARQTLTSYYYKNESINLGDKLSPIILKLGHQPTYFSFSVWYMFS